VLRQFLQCHRPAIGFRSSGILCQLGRAQMPQRHELAKIAVTFHVRCQQHQLYAREVSRFVERSGEWRVTSDEFRRARNVQCHADNRFYSRFLRQLVKLYRAYKPFVSVSATAGIFCSTAAATISSGDATPRRNE